MVNKKKVVVVGGGTGTFTLLRGLRNFADTIDITAVVTMADSGGSTGRLRDEFGQLPVGDVRQAIVALAPDIDPQHDLLRELFVYRFDKGLGLSGHTVGNLLLTAMTDMLGSEVKAIDMTSRLLRISGKVLPVTTHSVQLIADYASGRRLVGEHVIDETKDPTFHDDRITNLTLSPLPQVYKPVVKSIAEADMIVLGPGDFYTSIMATCVVPGVAEAIKGNKSNLVFVSNLMSRSGQTIGMKLKDYIAEIDRYIKRCPDIIVVPDKPISDNLVTRYRAEEKVHPVYFSGTFPAVKICPRPIVSEELVQKISGDILQRSLIRHDSTKLAKVIFELLKA